jgi:hypothetical protein
MDNFNSIANRAATPALLQTTSFVEKKQRNSMDLKR